MTTKPVTEKAKALRIFHNSGQIIWTHALEGSGDFPITVEESLLKLPVGTKAITIGQPYIDSFMNSDDNQVVNDTLIIGTPRLVLPEKIARDLAAELDTLKAQVALITKVD